jgi:PilZ domain-containing protein
MASTKILSPDPSHVTQQRRKEARWTTVLPLRLVSGHGEIIPAVILNVSASGLLALVDTRSSPLLPPPQGSRFIGEFFLDDVEIRQAVLEIVRIEDRGAPLMALGCCFVHPPSTISATLRTRIAAHLASKKP